MEDIAQKKKKNKKKVKKTIHIEENLEFPVGGRFNNIHGDVLKPCKQDNSFFRQLCDWNPHPKQTVPPTFRLQDTYEIFPEGEIFPNGRDQIEEDEQKLKDLRMAAEAHRQVRRYAQQIIKPGKKLFDITNQLEDMNRYILDQKGIERSIAFPTGCSINHVAAHWTPNTGDDLVLQEQDVCKIDFGCQINGRIIDCAFTVAFDPKYDDLLNAVKEATNQGIKEAGIDVRLGDIGAKVMTSHEVTLDGKTHTVQPCKTLSGHNIKDYIIHGGKQVPAYDNKDQTKMLENELYAVETFGSTGEGSIAYDYETSHYMRTSSQPKAFNTKNSKALFKTIEQEFGSLCFCRKWLDQMDYSGHILALKDLEKQGAVKGYPPLVDKKGTYVAQWEHTLLLRPHCKEVLSRGEDY